MMKESKVIGGIGEKKSNGGTQWYLQDRIYDGDIAITVATCCNPYYVVDNKMNKMNKRAKECLTKYSNDIQDETYIDCYNQTINQEVSGTISTRISGSNCYFVGDNSMSSLSKQVCNEALKKELVEPNDVIYYTYSNSRLKEMKDGYIRIQNKSDNQIMPTLITQSENLGVTVENMNNLAIRKLTPKECWRLQGFAPIRDDGTFDDSLFEKAAEVNSNAQLYKQAGNSITVDVLCSIFKSLFLEEEK